MNNEMNSGNAALITYAQGLHPQMELAPCDLQPGGRYALPPGFEIHLDPAHDESVIVFGPHDASARIKTLVQYGGRYLIRGLDLLRGLATALRVGEPVWEKSLEAQAEYFRALLAAAPPFIVPERGPMTRSEMEQYIDRDAHCQRAVGAFTEAIDAAGAPVTDVGLRDFIQRATDDPDSAVTYYHNLRDGRMGCATAPVPSAEKSARRKVGTPAAVEVAS